ncbi:hypothetical protein [Levilactobacillus brevis]|uniref:hypothetical protein n=1 Tax=Levilactobacillus brevis TaxID=1580 RepID=UPI0005B649F0|nr:hypothetical protein [Levilactobacillus brevis]
MNEQKIVRSFILSTSMFITSLAAIATAAPTSRQNSISYQLGKYPLSLLGPKNSGVETKTGWQTGQATIPLNHD